MAHSTRLVEGEFWNFEIDLRYRLVKRNWHEGGNAFNSSRVGRT
jgi:hypothetical protein